MNCDLLYVAHNRLAYTQTTFPALVENTNWDRVEHLHVLDDLSTDGSAEFLMAEVSEFYGRTGQKTDCVSDAFGGPVAAMNYALDHAETDVLVKVDSDLVCCPGWIDVLLDVLDANPNLDALGLEPGFAGRVQPIDVPRSYLPARHIGGIGAMRTRIFEKRRPHQHERFFGWTAFQREMRVNSGWVDPDLPCFLLDHLPLEPWASLSQVYADRQWSRTWSKYPLDWHAYWDWWLPDRVSA